jgi:hypothetical protein
LKLIGLTSSRKPPSRVRQLINELAFIIPNSVKIPRGHMNTTDLGLTAFNKGSSHLLIITSNHGNPGLLSGYEISIVNENLDMKWSFDCEIKWVKLSRDLKLNRVEKKIENIKFCPLSIHPDIIMALNPFFDNFQGPTDSKNEFILEHIHPGFLFYPKLNSIKFSPTLFFSRIILPDKSIEEKN